MKLFQPYFPKYSGYIFVFLFLLISWVFKFHEIIFLPPYSLHLWRQCDSLAITLNFMDSSRGIFGPAMLNLGDKLDSQSVGEFTGIYYIVGKLWSVFGHHEFIYRAFTLLFLFFGLFFLFRLSERLLNNSVLGIISALFIMTSPIIMLYGIGFTVNVPSYSLELIAWYSFYKFYSKEKTKWLWISMLLFTLAGLLKITGLISFIALIGIFILEKFRLVKFKENGRIFYKNISHILPFVFVILVNSFWIWFTFDYNEKHFGSVFNTHILPIWEMSKESFSLSIKHLFEFWLYQFFPIPMHIFGFLLFFIVIIFGKKVNSFLWYLSVLMSIGTAGFLVLFYGGFPYHDYQVANLFILFTLLLIFSIYIIMKRLPKLGNSIIFQSVLATFLIINIFMCSETMMDRRVGWPNDQFRDSYSHYKEYAAKLEELGIKKDDYIISIPDYSPNISLYFLNRYGWTDYGSNFKDTLVFEKRIMQGAKFIVINDSTVFNNYPVHKYLSKKIFEDRNTQIYSLSK